jgi:hypothetical protein
MNTQGIRYDRLVLSIELWKIMVTELCIPEERILSELSTWTEYSKAGSKSWVQLWNYRDLKSEAEFNTVLKDVEQKWENRTYTVPEEIMHVFCLFSSFSLKGIGPFVRDSEMTQIGNYLKELDERLEVDKTKTYIERGAAFGYGYYMSSQNQYYKKALELIEKQIHQIQADRIAEDAVSIHTLIELDPNSAVNVIAQLDVIQNDELFLQLEKAIKPKKLVASIMSRTGTEQWELIRAFERRYSHHRVAELIALSVISLEGLIAEFELYSESLIHEKKMSKLNAGDFATILKGVLANLKSRAQS